MVYKSEDGRVLETNEFMFGDYEIAYALCSNGDVIENFYDKNVLSVLLADTMGHDKEIGDDFKRYLSLKRKFGWGTGHDAERELSSLSRNFPRNEVGYETTPWNPYASFVKINRDSGLVQIANAGLEKPIYRDSKGNIETLDLFGNLEFYNRTDHSPTYKTEMKSGEMIILQSDGIKENMEEFHGMNSNEYLHKMLKYSNSASDLVSKIVDQDSLGRYCLPKDDSYDDISVLVVRKN